MNVNMEGSIIIFDEAHNIENTAEDGCSLEVTNSNLTTAL
jgi:Rad3-related DNA helicase